jgi:hypothetical protein
VEPDELSGEVGELRNVPLRRAEHKDKILPLHITEFVERVPEDLEVGLRTGDRTEHPNTGDFPRLLRVGCERRRKEAEGESYDAPDGTPPHGHLLKSASCRPSSSI